MMVNMMKKITHIFGHEPHLPGEYPMQYALRSGDPKVTGIFLRNNGPNGEEWFDILIGDTKDNRITRQINPVAVAEIHYEDVTPTHGEKR